MKRWLILLLVLLPLAFVLPADAERVCLEDPLAGLDKSRWTVQNPCFSFEGYVSAWADSSNGAYWLMVTTEQDGYWVKIFPEYGLSRPVAFERVIVTGALVTEYSSAGFFSKPILWKEIVPVWQLERPDVYREYPERRADGSVWLVQQWVDGHYTDRLVN